MHFRNSNIRTHQLHVQETNVSISQFHSIGNYFVGRCSENGRATCSWFMGRGDGSVMFVGEYHTANQLSSRKLRAEPHIQTQTKGELSHVDYVTTNANPSQGESQWYIFEDNEVVIKMIINRSPTMRHVSRTHRVALDWLVVRWNKLGPQNPNQITCDEWNHLLRFFNIMNFAMSCCSHFLSILKPNTMSKRAKEKRTEEELVVATPRPARLVTRNLSAKQFFSLNSGASYSLENQELCRNSVSTSSGHESNRAQERQRDADPFSRSGRPVRSVCGRSSTGRLVRGIENQLARTKWDYHNMQISNNQHIERVFRNVRQKLNRSKNEQIFVIKSMYWSGDRLCQERWKQQCILDNIMMSDLQEHQLRTAQDGVRHHAEVDLGSGLRDSECPFDRMDIYSVHETYLGYMTNNHVGESKSILCLGKMHSEAHTKMERSPSILPTVQGYKEISGIGGEPTECEWKISQNSQHCRLSKRFKTNWKLVTHVAKNLKIELS